MRRDGIDPVMEPVRRPRRARAERGCARYDARGGFGHHSTIKHGLFPFKLPKSGADISKRIVQLCNGGCGRPGSRPRGGRPPAAS
jgi:hypothetical protein